MKIITIDKIKKAFAMIDVDYENYDLKEHAISLIGKPYIDFHDILNQMGFRIDQYGEYEFAGI